MRIHDLYEKRRNPEINKKEDKLSVLKKYAGQDDIFVSFTTVHKIGINPKNQYKTPIGIYTYPIDYVLELKGDVPFAGEYPNIWAVRLKPELNYLVASEYTKKDFENDINKLAIFGENIPKGYAKATALVNKPAGYIWNITRILALILDNKNKGVITPPITNSTFTKYLEREQDDTSYTIQWNKIFRTLGYAGFIDSNNEGIIHTNETTQAVFFSKVSFDIIEVVRNVSEKSTKEQYDIWKDNIKTFLKDLNKHVIPDDIWPELLNDHLYEINKKMSMADLPDYVKEYMKNTLSKYSNINLLIKELHPSDDQIINCFIHNFKSARFILSEFLTPKIIDYLLNNPEQYIDYFKNLPSSIPVKRWVKVYKDYPEMAHRSSSIIQSELSVNQIEALLSLHYIPVRAIIKLYDSETVSKEKMFSILEKYFYEIYDNITQLSNFFVYFSPRVLPLLGKLTDNRILEICKNKKVHHELITYSHNKVFNWRTFLNVRVAKQLGLAK